VIRDWIPSFLDEMSKVASASLNKREKRRQAIQFGALGMLSGPVIGGVANMISRGRPLPEGVKSVPRWLASTMATGALVSGAIPAIRHGLERNIQSEANERLRRTKLRQERRGGA
jgi:hypothetical protein